MNLLRSIRSILVLAFILAGAMWNHPVLAEESQIASFTALPGTLQEYQSAQAELNSPEGAASLFVLAMAAYENDANLSLSFMGAALTTDNVVSSTDGSGNKLPNPNFMYYVDRQLKVDPNIARSYFRGSDPAQGYLIPQGALEIALSRNRLSVVSDKQVRIYVTTSGAGTPRPITLVKESDGMWRVNDAGSLFVGVYAPGN